MVKVNDMRYIDRSHNTTCLTHTDGWQYAAGYWEASGGELFNLPERVATQGGSLVLDNPKERKVLLLALNYAKQRRERSLLTLQREIANLDKAIKQL